MVADRLVLRRPLAAQLEAPQRPRDLVACGARRETRLQKARSSSSCSALTMSMPCGRPPVPSANGAHGAEPVRAQASAPSAMRPSPNRRSARNSSRSTSLPWAIAARGSARLCAEDDEQVVLFAARPSACRLLRRALQGVGMGDQQAACQRQLRRGDRQAVQGRHERDLTRRGESRVLQALERALDALLVLTDLRAVEVGLLVEDLLQQHEQRGVCTATARTVATAISVSVSGPFRSRFRSVSITTAASHDHDLRHGRAPRRSRSSSGRAPRNRRAKLRLGHKRRAGATRGSARR